MSKKIDSKIKLFLSEITKILNIEKVYVFGSYITKKYRTNYSDIDIAIFSRDINDKNKFFFQAKILSLITKYKIDIQPLLFNINELNNDSFVLSEIINKGKLITA